MWTDDEATECQFTPCEDGSLHLWSNTVHEQKRLENVNKWKHVLEMTVQARGHPLGPNGSANLGSAPPKFSEIYTTFSQQSSIASQILSQACPSVLLYTVC